MSDLLILGSQLSNSCHGTTDLEGALSRVPHVEVTRCRLTRLENQFRHAYGDQMEELRRRITPRCKTWEETW